MKLIFLYFVYFSEVRFLRMGLTRREKALGCQLKLTPQKKELNFS
jgi:hypothetical protein